MNPPKLELIEGIYVVRDDLIPGGTKQRVIPQLLHGADEFVYASPAYGYAQVALAYSDTMAQGKVFCRPDRQGTGRWPG